MDYGTGAIFGCPAHDQRDLDFARKYKLKVKAVVIPEDEDPAEFKVGDEAYTGPGRLANSSFLNGKSVEDAKEEVAQRLGKRNMGEKRTTFRLRDWGVSRQRYWGCPIPMIHCAKCGIVPVPDKDLPVRLPERCLLRQARKPARPASNLEARQVPHLRRQGHARNRHLRHFRRQLLVFRALLLAAREGAARPGAGRSLAARGSIYRRRRARDPAPALCALLHPRHEGLRLFERGRALRGAVHARHGAARNLLRRSGGEATGSIRPMSSSKRRMASAKPTRRMRRGLRFRSAPSRRCRSRRRTPSTPTFSRSITAPTPRAGSCCRTARPSATCSGPKKARKAPWRFVQRAWRLISESLELLPKPKAKAPAEYSPAAQALRRAAHKGLNAVAEEIEGLRFNRAIASVYEFANALSAALQDKAARGERLFRLRAQGGADLLRPRGQPHHAAPGRGGLVAVRLQHPDRK